MLCNCQVRIVWVLLARERQCSQSLPVTGKLCGVFLTCLFLECAKKGLFIPSVIGKGKSRKQKSGFLVGFLTWRRISSSGTGTIERWNIGLTLDEHVLQSDESPFASPRGWEESMMSHHLPHLEDEKSPLHSADCFVKQVLTWLRSHGQWDSEPRLLRESEMKITLWLCISTRVSCSYDLFFRMSWNRSNH